MDSYHVDALQYIEKPFSDNILFSELKRAIKIYKTLNHTVQFQTFEGHKLVKTSDIIYLETSYDRYKVILTNSKNHYGSYRNVKKVRQYLLDHYFFKLNRSTTINLSHVETYTCNSITMSNHDILPLTKSKKKEFLKCYYDFMDKDDEDNK